MDIKPIRTKRDYETALREIQALMDAKRGTREGDRLEVLVTLVEAYEARHFPLDLPDPVEAIKFVMEQRALAPKDLVALHVRETPASPERPGNALARARSSRRRRVTPAQAGRQPGSV